jgi:hypothetical protein
LRIPLPEAASLFFRIQHHPKSALCMKPQFRRVRRKLSILKVFASRDAAQRWFTEHDPEGVAFEYPVID